MRIRLDKYLADMSLGTRTQVKEYIKTGRIMVDDVVIKDAGFKIDTEVSSVCFDKKSITYEEFEYYVFHKPAGVITATEDRQEKTVMDFIDGRRKDLFPVGRLDKDTEGLLLITNNGELAHNMLSPKKHVWKTYYAELSKTLSKEDCENLVEGVLIEKDVKSQPAKLEVISNDADCVKVHLTISEGRFHQVKKMFHAVKNEVTYLKRLTFGPLVLDDKLTKGNYRKLTDEELKNLQPYM